MKLINEAYDKPLNSSMGNFVNFVKINTDDYSKGEKEDLEWLARRVASNMYYFESNIETAKSDYVINFIKIIK